MSETQKVKVRARVLNTKHGPVLQPAHEETRKKAEPKASVKWVKGEDPFDGSPRYSIEGRNPGSSYERVTAVIVQEKEYNEFTFRKEPRYYGSVYDNKAEYAIDVGPFRAVKDAKVATEQAFHRMMADIAREEAQKQAEAQRANVNQVPPDQEIPDKPTPLRLVSENANYTIELEPSDDGASFTARMISSYGEEKASQTFPADQWVSILSAQLRADWTIQSLQKAVQKVNVRTIVRQTMKKATGPTKPVKVRQRVLNKKTGVVVQPAHTETRKKAAPKLSPPKRPLKPENEALVARITGTQPQYLQYDAEALKKSRPVKGHTRKTESGQLTLVAPHMDKRDPAKPKQTKPRAKAQPKLRTPGIKTSAFEMDERKLSALTERVKKLNAAAKRLGIQPITMEITGERWDEAPGRFPAPGMPPEMIPVKMLSVRISGPEPTLADWEFAAVVTPEGNKHLIRKMGDGEDVPTRYRSTRSGKRMYCEHCNSSRARKKCFILRNTETGEYKMVGSTCIGDFLGHAAGNAEKLAEWYEGFAYLDDYEGAADEADMGDDGFDRPGHYVSAEKYLAHVVALIEQNGWTSRSARYDDSGMATADQALINMIDERKRDDTIPVTEKHWKKARAVRKWLKGLKKEDLTSDYLYNLSVVGKEPAVSMNGIGILASAVVAYEKAKGEELSKKKAAKGEGPKHVGTVGERSTFDVTVVREHVTEGFYGTTYIYGLEDQDGNKLTWFASNPVLEQGQRVKLLATVKAHDEYKGVPQTVITRAKVVEESKLKKALGWLRKALVRAHPMRTASGELTMRRQHSRNGSPAQRRMESLGFTEDMQRAAFLAPDGRMVDGGSRGNLLVRNARDEHESLVYWAATGETIPKVGTDRHMRAYHAIRDEHFPAIRRLGYMRVNFRPNGWWAIEVHPGVTSAQINTIEQLVKFHTPEKLVVGVFNGDGAWSGDDFDLENPSPAQVSGALRRAQEAMATGQPLQKARNVKAHPMRTASGELTMRRQHTDKRDAAQPQFKEKRVTPKGNVQYIYDEETTEQAKAEKFRRAVTLAQQLPSILEDLKTALAKGDTPREKVVAAIVALIDRCQFRIGTDEYAEKHGTFGVTTLRPEHVTVSGSEVRFQFTGKKQVPWDKAVTDPDLAKFIEHLSADSPGDRLFWYNKDGKQYPVKASHVNAFLSEYGVTAKDLRTYHATKAMFEELKAASRPEKSEPLTKKETAARLKAAFEKVAYQMGHTPAVCRTSYVLPQLVDDFVQNGGRLSLSAWEGAVR